MRSLTELANRRFCSSHHLWQSIFRWRARAVGIAFLFNARRTCSQSRFFASIIGGACEVCERMSVHSANISWKHSTARSTVRSKDAVRGSGFSSRMLRLLFALSICAVRRAVCREECVPKLLRETIDGFEEERMSDIEPGNKIERKQREVALRQVFECRYLCCRITSLERRTEALSSVGSTKQGSISPPNRCRGKAMVYGVVLDMRVNLHLIRDKSSCFNPHAIGRDLCFLFGIILLLLFSRFHCCHFTLADLPKSHAIINLSPVRMTSHVLVRVPSPPDSMMNSAQEYVSYG